MDIVAVNPGPNPGPNLGPNTGFFDRVPSSEVFDLRANRDDLESEISWNGGLFSVEVLPDSAELHFNQDGVWMQV